MNLDFPGAVLALTRRGNHWPPERQAKLETLIDEITRADDKLPSNLQELWEAMPNGLYFLEYACDVAYRHKLVVDAFRVRDWRAYIESHPDFLWLSAFGFAVRNGLDGDLYWQLLTLVYVHDERAEEYGFIYRGFYTGRDNIHVPPNRRAAMNADELLFYDALPELVTVYRGEEADPVIETSGLSWTLEHRIAYLRAARYCGVVEIMQIPKKAILVYYAARGEAEVLIDHAALSKTGSEVLPVFRGDRKPRAPDQEPWEDPWLDDQKPIGLEKLLN